MRSNVSNIDRKENVRTNVAHPWLNAESVSTFFVSVAGNPNRREFWIGAASDNFNFGEETIEDMHSPRSGEDSNEDDTILSYAVI
jgi:hypothetical protein